MLYQPGNYVYPADLPRRVLCRVEQAETLTTSSGSVQVLRLEPLEGPWPHGTVLIRLDDYVVPVQPSELWQSSPSIWSSVLRTHSARPRSDAPASDHKDAA